MTDMRPNAAIYYVAESYDTSQKKLVGRQSASEGFLRAYLRHSGVDRFYCMAANKSQFELFRRHVVRWSSNPNATAHWIPFARPERLSTPGCLYHPDPNIAERGWLRRGHDERGYSICGVTHTICTAAVMDAIGSLMISPLHEWDAVICTSSAVKRTFERVLGHWSAYLADRLDARPSLRLELPVIPLGVDCDAFDQAAGDAGSRQTLRNQLGIADDDIAFLFMGRLNFHAKAHPLPMYMALEQAARRTGKQLHLIQSGWIPHPKIGEQMIQGAKNHCPSVNVVFVDGRQPEVRKSIWFAADIFTSLSDNIQETFGLVPIEAMAAGLPQVITDWDGYCDTVRNEIDGFRVTTTLPPGGTGEDLVTRYTIGVDSYDRYLGHSSQCTAVDVAECVEAYVRLIENPQLRQTMGEAGRQRARDSFDWSVVIKAYQDLWGNLDRRRQHAAAPPRRPDHPAHPLREDPFALFAHYATEILQPETILELQPDADTARLDELYASGFTNYAQYVVATKDECQAALAHLANGPCRASDLLELIDADRRDIMNRTLGWFAKTNLVHVVR